MINRNTNRVNLPSFVPKFSDGDILKSVLNSDIWKHLFLRDKKAAWLVFQALFFMKIEMFIVPIKSVLRYDHGHRTFGVFITLMSATMMIAFNTNYVGGYLATFVPFTAPVAPFFMTEKELWQAAFLDIKSNSMLFFWIVSFLFSLIHLFRMNRKWGNPETPSTRGNSILYVLLFRFLWISERTVKLYIEPLIVGSFGYLLLTTNTDFTFGLFLMIAAGCLFFQDGYDALMKFAMTP